MKITHYAFGSITIDGNTYTKDVIIYPDRVFSPWWRKEGHLLQPEDLGEIIQSGISILIIGTGYYGTMKVPAEILSLLESKNIEAIVGKTQEAVDRYNEIAAAKHVAAAFHLTC